MSKNKNYLNSPTLYGDQTLLKDDGNNYELKVNHFINQSPYYITCTDAFDKSNAIVVAPYAAAYDAANASVPLTYDNSSESNPGFDEVIYGASAEAAKPVKKEKVKANKPKKASGKRIIALLLALILAVVALAIPVVSSLELVSDFVDIDVDILAIADIFEGDLGLDTLTDNLPIIILAVFMVFALILTLILLFALLGKKRKRFGIIALITFLLAAAFLVATFEFDFTALIDSIADIDYGIFALIGCPLLVFILSGLSYKKLK